MKKKLLKGSILSASLLVASGPAINANIPQIAAAFPDIPLATIELLSTIPSLFLMLSVLMSSFIANKLKIKRTIMIGLGLVMVCGFMPALINNFYLIVVSRALLGFGIGLFNSLLVILANYFYEGHERTTFYGLQASCEGIGGMIITFIAGQLININWQAPFYSYLLAVPVFFLFLFFVPKIENTTINKKESHREKQQLKSYFPLVKYVILVFIIAIFYMTMGIKTTPIIIEGGYGDASDSSLVLLLVGFGSMISGFIFGKVYKVLKKNTLIIAMLLIAFSLFLIGVANNVMISYAGGFLIGFGFRLFLPYLVNSVNRLDIPNKGLATSLILVGYNLGVAITPYVSLLLQQLPFLDNLVYLLYFEAFVIVVMVIVIIFRNMLIKNN